MKFNRDERRLRELSEEQPPRHSFGFGGLLFKEATAEEMRPDFLRRLKELEAKREKRAGEMNQTGVLLVNRAIATCIADLRSVAR